MVKNRGVEERGCERRRKTGNIGKRKKKKRKEKKEIF